MSIGITATANIKNILSTQKTLSSLASEYEASISNYDNYSMLTFCNMGDLHVYFETEKKITTMTMEANTSLVGAGFHHYVVTFLDDFIIRNNISLDVHDETEYFEHRNFEQMRENHFRWLKSIISFADEKIKEDKNYSQLCICWNLDTYIPNDISATIVTPLGRFNIKTLTESIKKDTISPFADIYFIWNNKEKDALFYRNNALQLMWESIRFAPITHNDLEEINNNTVIKYLEKSAALDSTLPFPKKEYIELCSLSEHKPIDISKLTEYKSDYPIGYRRDNISHKLGSLEITFPGSFFYENDLTDDYGDFPASDDGCFLVYNMDENWRNIRCSEITFEPIEGKKPTFSEASFKNAKEEPVTINVGDEECRYAFIGDYEEEGEIFYQTMAQVITMSSLFIITISYLQKSDKVWAEEIIKNLKVNNNYGKSETETKTY